jgi:prepilin-type N-terminal cleavage/methylation domain-containing protein
MMKKGMSLIEVILALSIVAVLMVFMTISLNPSAMMGRARDAQRKKDIGKIKLAMEEYYSDRGCYPRQDVIDAIGCSSRDFNPWLDKWPCDPKGTKYLIAVGEDVNCPNQYRILTELENKFDSDIPSGWYESAGTAYYLNGTVTREEVNYGASSTNISWYDQTLDPICSQGIPGCYRRIGEVCTSWAGGPHSNAYVSQECLPQCQVSCCLNGEVCN